MSNIEPIAENQPRYYARKVHSWGQYQFSTLICTFKNFTILTLYF